MLKSRTGFLPIHFAARHADAGLLGTFLQSHNRRQTGETVREGENVLMQAAGWGSAETVAVLLEKKAKLQGADAHGATALHYAARAGNISTLGVLIEYARSTHPTLVDLADHGGLTPLMTACRNGRLQAVQLLLGRGCNAAQRSSSGETALTEASRRGNADIVRAAR
jgi:ankyrin repeat protein